MKKEIGVVLGLILGLSTTVWSQDSTDVVWLEKEIRVIDLEIRRMRSQRDSLYSLGVKASEIVDKKRYLIASTVILKKIEPKQVSLLRLQELLIIEEKKQTKLLRSLQPN